jgi:hypothetical protein
MEVIDEPLLQENVTVERVAVNRVVDAPMAIDRKQTAAEIVPSTVFLQKYRLRKGDE